MCVGNISGTRTNCGTSTQPTFATLAHGLEGVKRPGTGKRCAAQRYAEPSQELAQEIAAAIGGGLIQSASVHKPFHPKGQLPCSILAILFHALAVS